MGDPGSKHGQSRYKAVTAELQYEVRLQQGPIVFSICGQEFALAEQEDMCVLVRAIKVNGHTVTEKIVGVIGAEGKEDPRETVNLVSFLRTGGAVGLSRNLV